MNLRIKEKKERINYLQFLDSKKIHFLKRKIHFHLRNLLINIHLGYLRKLKNLGLLRANQFKRQNSRLQWGIKNKKKKNRSRNKKNMKRILMLLKKKIWHNGIDAELICFK